MKQGQITYENHDGGLQLRAVPGRQQIPIAGTQPDYLFQGHKSTILRYLLDTEDYEINLKSEDAANGTSICVQIYTVADNVAKQWGQAFGGPALGAAGNLATGAGSAVFAMSATLDGISAAGMVRSSLPGGNQANQVPSRPGGVAFALDHALNGKIGVRLSCYKDSLSDWLATGFSQITHRYLATIVKSRT